MISKSFTKRLISTVLMIIVVFSLAACGNKTDTGATLSREAVFKNLVQTTVNKYGISEHDINMEGTPITVNGLLDAKAMDITGDGEDELFLVYVDDNVINMEIYEYQKGNAIKAWNEIVDSYEYHLKVQQVNETGKIYWVYGDDDKFDNELCIYEDGEYKYASDYPEPPEDVVKEIVDKYPAYSDIIRAKEKSKFNIHTTEDEETTHMYLFYIGGCRADKDELVERWGITIPGPRVSPMEALQNIEYYGDMSICKMPKEMALAYAEAIESEEKLAEKTKRSSKVNALLMDIANDGMPLLITAITEADYDELAVIDKETEPFNIWTWDGKTAKKYDFMSDLECSYTFDYTFVKNQTEEMIYVEDGYAMGAGDFGGHISYKVSNATISKVNHIMTYTTIRADEDSDIMFGVELPGVNAEKDSEAYYAATIDELIEAGWVGREENRYDNGMLSLRTVNGEIVKYSSYEEYMNDNERIYGYMDKDSYNIYTATTGDNYIEGKWSTPENAKKALELYSKVAGKPFYNYDEVKLLLDDSQLEAIAQKVAEKVKGEIGEIYKLNDSLYLVVIYVDGNVSGTVIVKNTKNGTEWRVVAYDSKAMTEDIVSNEINKDSQKVNIKLDIKKVDEGGKHLETALGDIDGVTPNSEAQDEIITYIETSVSQNSKISIKAKENAVLLNKNDVEKAIEKAQKHITNTPSF